MVGFRAATVGVRWEVFPIFLSFLTDSTLTSRSDNIGMGHDGMSYSLPSRDLIAGKSSDARNATKTNLTSRLD